MPVSTHFFKATEGWREIYRDYHLSNPQAQGKLLKPLRVLEACHVPNVKFDYFLIDYFKAGTVI